MLVMGAPESPREAQVHVSVSITVTGKMHLELIRPVQNHEVFPATKGGDSFQLHFEFSQNEFPPGI